MKSPHLDPDWLRARYVDDGLSTYAIGRLVGRDPKQIHTKLVDFGIPRRPKWCAIAAEGNSVYVNPRRGWHHTDETRARCTEAAGRARRRFGADNPMHGKRGALHHNFKGGSTPERQAVYASAEWSALVRVVLARDEYKCRRCGTGNHRARMRDPSNLHIHHIKGWSEYPALRLDAANVIVLCDVCHHWVHSNANTSRAFIE